MTVLVCTETVTVRENFLDKLKGIFLISEIFYPDELIQGISDFDFFCRMPCFCTFIILYSKYLYMPKRLHVSFFVFRVACFYSVFGFISVFSV